MEIVALRKSAAHLRSACWVPIVTLMVIGSIASLKLTVNGVPGSISTPSPIAVPPAPVTDMIRGTMLVVNTHRPPAMRWWLRSSIGPSVTV